MIGRGAIRNPWLFHQIRQHLRGEVITPPPDATSLVIIQHSGNPRRASMRLNAPSANA